MGDENKYEYSIDVWDDLAREEYTDVTLGPWKDTLSSDYDEDQDAFKSINDRLSTIEKRLAILVPDKKLLKKYEILQDIYNQYKAAEALLDGPDPESVS
jgi:hypothetical protein